MKKITNLNEYKALSELPGKIQQLRTRKKGLLNQYLDATDALKSCESAIDRAYKEGNQAEIKLEKKVRHDFEQELKKLQGDIDQANEDLQQAETDLAEAKAAYTQKVKPIIDAKLKEFEKSLAETERLNDELLQIQSLSSFGMLTKRVPTITKIPHLNFKKGTGAYSPSKNLKRQIANWNG